MILYPAIDLKGGQCVRLLRGEMAAATVYNDDPAAQARAFSLVKRSGSAVMAAMNCASLMPPTHRSNARS